MEENYKVIKVCKNCSAENSWSVSKVDASFNTGFGSFYNNKACPECSSIDFKSMSFPYVRKDQELFDIWSKDDELCFDEQDEAIVLAEMENFNFLVGGVDNPSYSENKRSILLESLCILYYDNVYLSPVDEYSEETLENMAKCAKIVKPELDKRKLRLIETETPFSDYVREAIYPLLGIPYVARYG